MAEGEPGIVAHPEFAGLPGKAYAPPKETFVAQALPQVAPLAVFCRNPATPPGRARPRARQPGPLFHPRGLRRPPGSETRRPPGLPQAQRPRRLGCSLDAQAAARAKSDSVAEKR